MLIPFWPQPSGGGGPPPPPINLYPTIAGLSYDVVRTPMWGTGRQVAITGKRTTRGYRLYPLIHFELTYQLLRDDLSPSDVKAIEGLFNWAQGQVGTFLFTDPDFNTFSSANAQLFGTADGSTTQFQLIAYYQNAGGPGYREIIQCLNGTPTIYANGVALTSGYTANSTGLVTFNTAPAASVALTWAGSFYYCCAFDDDTLDIVKFMSQFWSLKAVPFTSVKL